MFTELLRKQLQATLETIYFYQHNFITHFFSEKEADLAMEKAITYYIAFDDKHIYVQKYWVDTESKDQVQEVNIDYDDYNEWYKGLDV